MQELSESVIAEQDIAAVAEILDGCNITEKECRSGIGENLVIGKSSRPMPKLVA